MPLTECADITGTDRSPVTNAIASLPDPLSADPADVARICAFLDGEFATLDESRTYGERAAGSLVPSVRAHGEVVRAFHLMREGDAIGALDLNRRALRTLWGTGARSERVACANLAAASVSERRTYEALVFAHRGLALAASGGRLTSPLIQSAMLSRLAACGQAGAWEKYDSLEEAVGSLVAGAPDMLRHAYHGICTDAALDRGRIAHARKHHARALEFATDLTAGYTDGRCCAVAEARLLLREGRPLDALRAARRSRDLVEADDRLDTVARIVELIARERAASESVKPADVAAVLADLRGPLRRSLAANVRSESCVELAALATRLGDRALAADAYDLAGTALIERMAEIEAFRQQFPELHDSDPDVVSTLASHRDRHLAAHTQLMSRVARLFAGDEQAVRTFVAAGTARQSMLRVCAWCRRAWGPEGSLVELPNHPLPRHDDVSVSHGMCTDCHDGEIASMSRAQEAG